MGRSGNRPQRLLSAPNDPDLLVEGQLWLERLQEAAKQQGLVLANITGDSGALQSLQHVFSCSPFIAKNLLQHPEWLLEFTDTAALHIPFNISRFDDFCARLQQATDAGEFMQLLRLLRQREISRIGLRDLLAWADLSETLNALSELADFCLRQAHAKAYALQCERYGIPLDEQGVEQSLVVLAMGKLGGGELNYSSDIDVIFAYPEEGQTEARGGEQHSIDNNRFFIGQAQLIIKFLHETMADGFVFRVDARLRPFGDSGALVVSFDSMETYYQNQGRDWERYAMIKARPVCGKPEHMQVLMQLLQPFVYRRYLDYGAFSALRDMKAMIEQEVIRKGLQDNVKLGSGGIREVEFIGQAYQLIRGGREPELRERRIQIVLERLAERGIFEAETVDSLQAAYCFLRDTENRLQMQNDQQVHCLPKSNLERKRLAYAMGFDNWDSFILVLDQYRAVVNATFNEVFFAHADEVADENELQLRQFVDGEVTESQALALFSHFDNAAELLTKFRDFFASLAFRRSSAAARQQLAKLLPDLIEELAQQGDPCQALHRVLALFQAIIQRPVYLALLIESPTALKQMTKLFAASDWIAGYLVRQPILLDSLLDVRQLYSLPSKDELLKNLQDLMQTQTEEDPERRLNAVRHFKQEQILRIAAVDVSEHLPLMKVSDQLTWLAEAILVQVHEVAVKELFEKYGTLANNPTGDQPEMAIIGYGKLGGIELGYASDLDIVFLHNCNEENQATQGKRSIHTQTYFARLAQRLVHWLTTPTLGGVLYEADIRLRPDGASGLLVSSMEQFECYQAERAWVWEHQALVRARTIVGSPRINQAFMAIRHRILTQQRDPAELKKEVVEMRERMRKEAARSGQGEVDLKHDRGCLVDIEFLVQYGVLAWAYKNPQLAQYPDNIRILEQFGQLGLMPKEETVFLSKAYLTLREQIHRRALEGEKAVIDQAQAASDMIERVGLIWHKWMNLP